MQAEGGMYISWEVSSVLHFYKQLSRKLDLESCVCATHFDSTEQALSAHWWIVVFCFLFYSYVFQFVRISSSTKSWKMSTEKHVYNLHLKQKSIIVTI